jgi:hypothetical protein
MKVKEMKRLCGRRAEELGMSHYQTRKFSFAHKSGQAEETLTHLVRNCGPVANSGCKWTGKRFRI